MALLGKLIADVAAGTGGALLVEGEEGVGKTALLRAGLAGAVAAGCAVAWATADEATRSLPFGMVAEWRDQLPGPAVLTDSEHIVKSISRQCAIAPLVLVAENLQWADEASALALCGLAEAARRLRLLVVASRRVPVRADGGCRAARGWSVLSLNPLPPPEAAILLERMAGGRPGRRLTELAGQAGGNALYLRELIGALTRDNRVRVIEGQAEIADQAGPDAPIAMPPALIALARARAAEFGEAGAKALRWAALLGPEFPLRELALITGWDAGELREFVSLATTTRILTVTGTRAEFRHGVIRQALYQGMPASVRAALHLRAAKVLADAGVRPARVAAQLAAVAEVGQEWAVDWLARAVPALLGESPVLAAELLGRVLAGLADTDPRREELQVGRVAAAFHLDRYEEAERVGSHVLASTRDAGRAAEVSWFLAQALLRAGRAAEAAELTTAGLRRPGLSEPWAVRLEAARALALAEQGPRPPAAGVPSAAENAAAAAARAERAGDRLASALALQALSHVYLLRSDHTARLEMLDQALVAVGGEAEDTGLRLQLLARRSQALRRLGRQAEAQAVAEEATRHAERAGRLGWLAHGELAAVYFTVGRWDDALAELELAASLSAPAWHRLLTRGYRALIAVSRDDAEGIRTHLDSVRDTPLGDPRSRANASEDAGPLLRARALAAERAGQAGEAAGTLAEILDGPWADGLSMVCEVLPLLTRLARAAGAVAIADAAAAAAVAAAAAAKPERMPSMLAIADHCRGLVAEDPALVLAAARGYQSARGPHDQALALEDAADLLASQGEAVAARARLRDAIGLYQGLGAQWDIRRAGARLRARGVRRPLHPGPSGPRHAAHTGWGTLTPAERQVAGLVVSGQSNPEIAAGLLISPRTVQTHVSHILAKLGAQSRAEIAGKASSASSEAAQ